MFPMQKISRLAAAPLRPAVLDLFVFDAAQSNHLKEVKGSRPVLSSSFGCYMFFCQLRSVAPCPPTEEAAIQWISAFNDTATFENYVSHLQK